MERKYSQKLTLNKSYGYKELLYHGMKGENLNLVLKGPLEAFKKVEKVNN